MPGATAFAGNAKTGHDVLRALNVVVCGSGNGGERTNNGTAAGTYIYAPMVGTAVLLMSVNAPHATSLTEIPKTAVF
jgi:hypothetical protein